MSSRFDGYTRLSQDEDEVKDVRMELREKSTLSRRAPKGVYFNDGAPPRRRIDYVLVYETNQNGNDSNDSKQTRLRNIRQAYEKSLRKEGILIEYDEIISPQVGPASPIAVLHMSRILFI